MTVTYAQKKARVDGYGLDVLALIHAAIAAGDHQPDVVVTVGEGYLPCYVEATQADEWYGPEATVTTVEHDSTVIVHASRVALASHIEYTACDVCGGTAVICPPIYVPARCGKDECRNETFTTED